MVKKCMIHIVTLLCVISCLLLGTCINNKQADKVYVATGSASSVPAGKRPDILVLGSSGAYRFIVPALIWKYTGITSTIIGTSAQPFSQIAAEVKQSESILHPKLYIIEIRRLIIEDAEAKKQSASTVNLQKLLTMQSIKMYQGVLSVGMSKAQPKLDPTPYKGKSKTLNKNRKKELIKLLQLCRTDKLKVMFLSTPYVENKRSIELENYAGRIIKSYGFTYINENYNYSKIGINFATDYYDNRHVNVLGAIKVTRYLSTYLKKNYASVRSGSSAARTTWRTVYEAWSALEKKQIADTKAMIKKASAKRR